MRGFLFGSLVLIAIEVFGQPNGTGALSTGGGWLISAMRRALSPDVAGVPQVGAQPTPAPAAGGGGKVVAR